MTDRIVADVHEYGKLEMSLSSSAEAVLGGTGVCESPPHPPSLQVTSALLARASSQGAAGAQAWSLLWLLDAQPCQVPAPQEALTASALLVHL